MGMRGRALAAGVLVAVGILQAADSARGENLTPQQIVQLQAELQMYKATAERHKEKIAELEKKIQELEKQIADQQAVLEQLRQRISKTLPDKPVDTTNATYLVIPVRGEIGTEFTVATLEAYLKQAAELMPTVVVLEMDTPGGSIEETDNILTKMIEYKGVRFVALVKRALSAGAPITLACREIYVTDNAMIGGAVPFQRTGPLPKELEEKYKSVWRAACRRAADYGQHPSVLAEAMVDPNIVLSIRMQGGKAVIEQGMTGKVIKPRGRILTLTAKEAIDYQVAKGKAMDYAAVGEALGLAGWKMVGPEPAASPPTPEAPKAGEMTAYALYQKAKSLGFDRRDMTDLQQTEALNGWQTWLTEQKVIGQRVARWTIKVEEVTQVEAKKVEVQLGQAKAKQAQYEAELVSLRRQRRASDKDAITKAIDNVAKAKDDVAKYTRMVKDAQDYPYLVLGTAAESQRVIVSAMASQASKDYLATVSTGKYAVVTGTIGQVELVQFRDGGLGVAVMLEQCEQAR